MSKEARSPGWKESLSVAGYGDTMVSSSQNGASSADVEGVKEVGSDVEISKRRKSTIIKPSSKRERLTVQLGARVSGKMWNWLSWIAEYEGLEYADVTRFSILQTITRYRRDPFFVAWMKEKAHKEAPT